MDRNDLSMTLEDQSDSQGQGPNWDTIAHRFYEALQNHLSDAPSDILSGKTEGGAKPKRPTPAPGLKLAEHRVGRYRSPA